ncbi:MAG: TlpA disulfide reductase family protein [Actinomycetota bacterium]
MRRAIAALLLIAAALVAACSSGGSSGAVLLPPEERTPAKAFAVDGLDGGTVRLSDFKGTPVLLNFWASWCVPCRKETPALVRFQKAHPGIRVVGIAVNDKPADSRAFARRFDIPYPLGSDPDGRVGEDYEILGIPTTFLIDAQGRLAAPVSAGPVEDRYLETLAAALGV